MGQLFSLFIVTTAASETAIGLSLLIISSRLNNKVSYNSLISLRG
jgi:NADH:ubiquinone oxidoreductase subunit K